MQHLSLQLFNSFQASLNEQPITTFESDKVRGLLIYLAVEAQQAHSREKLAGLLWPDFSEQSAHTNLRRALANLRKAIHDAQAEPPFLTITRSTLQFNTKSDHTLDVAPFLGLESEHKISTLEARVTAYQGPFLDGFSVVDSASFEEWLTLKREQFRRIMSESLQKLILHYETEHGYSSAIAHAYRLVDLEPWLEEGHQALMRLLALAGERGRALAQFEACQLALQDGLGVEVSTTTRTLYEQIKAGIFGIGATALGVSEIRRTEELFPAHNLPSPTVAFIGRQHELHVLTDLLMQDDNRLITILGPGGIGKSHLSLELGRRLLNQFPHGIFFVSLTAIQQVQQIVPTIAVAVGCPLQNDERSPNQQLQDYFRAKTLLLILDNMEQLLAGVGLISGLLQTAPNLKIIVTSRERLKLHSETVFPLTGLAFSEEVSTITSNDDAVQLFYKTARRIQPDLAMTTDHTQTIGMICRFVEGMPLAILLAASWIEQLTLAEILTELTEHSRERFDLLTTDLLDIPKRHQRIHTVFDHSWQRLTADEQQVFMNLSAFRGGFTREAAQTVAKASPRILTNLVNKSLLNRTAAGRYSIHELLRHFGALKLEMSPNHISIGDAHAVYYAEYLAARGVELKGSRQVVALREIEQEIGNIQQAWQWVIEQTQLTPMAKMIEGLGIFYEWKGRSAEADTAFPTGAKMLSGMNSAEGLQNYVQVLAWYGVHCAKLGDIETALQRLDQSRKLIDQASLSGQVLVAEKAFTLWRQAELVMEQDFAEAKRLYTESLACAQMSDDQWGIAYLKLGLAKTIGYLTPYEEELKLQLMKESLAIHTALGNDIGALETLGRLGFETAMRGDFAQSAAWFEQARLIYQKIGGAFRLPQWIPVSGVAYWAMGRFEDALTVHQEQLAILKNLGEVGSIVGASASLGMSHTFLGHYVQGIQLIETAMLEYQQKGGKNELAFALLQLGAGYIGQGNYQDAYNTLQECVALHRATKANVRLYTVLNIFGVAAWHTGQTAEATSAQDEVLVYLAQDEHYFIQIGLMPLVILLQLSQGDPVFAVELYALAQTHPHIRNSQWSADIVGKHVDAAARSLAPDVVAAAQARGRKRTLNTTIQELIAIMERDVA